MAMGQPDLLLQVMAAAEMNNITVGETTSTALTATDGCQGDAHTNASPAVVVSKTITLTVHRTVAASVSGQTKRGAITTIGATSTTTGATSNTTIGATSTTIGTTSNTTIGATSTTIGATSNTTTIGATPNTTTIGATSNTTIGATSNTTTIGATSTNTTIGATNTGSPAEEEPAVVSFSFVDMESVMSSTVAGSP
ncbi:hypothetical protein ACOMHN_002389 [Nucella lapillus]